MLKSHLLLLASACIAATLLPAGPPPETKGMPYELAFRRKTFQVQANPVVSPDGALVAYVVRTPPERSPSHNLPVEPRFLPNGTPVGAVGSRLFVTEVATGKTQTVCPETGNCWRPSWSPDGKLLVFFSDAGGPPQLWAFDQDRRQPRRISSVAVKAKHWMGDEAQWSPDGKEAYVSLNLTPAAAKPASEPASPDGAAPPPRVYRHGRELESQPEAKKPDPMDFSIRENNATLAAIDVASGKTRILAPAETDPQPSCLRLSPGGKWVSYLSVQRLKNPRDFEPHYDLAVMPAAGGAVRVLARDLELPFNADNYFTDTYRWRPPAISSFT